MPHEARVDDFTAWLAESDAAGHRTPARATARKARSVRREVAPGAIILEIAALSILNLHD